MAHLKVLLLGGLLCGKTSLLASLFHSMTHGMTSEYLSACDKTPLEAKDGDWEYSLTGKRLELEYFISKGKNNTFLAEKRPGHIFSKYVLQLQIPGTDKRMEIEFLDVPGSFLQNEKIHLMEIISFVNESDIIVVVVDTPYLMVGSKEIAEAANAIDTILTLLMQVDCHETEKAKQILFVPVKCEKWVKEGKIDNVSEKVEEMYQPIIRDFRSSYKNELSIIPVETAGDILFSELKDPYVLFNQKTQSQIICAKLSDRIVLLSDGKVRKITEDEIIINDPCSVFRLCDDGKCFNRPKAWFHLRNEPKAVFSPHNCEQILLHIIRFMYKKKKSEYSSFIIERRPTFFGNISLNDIENLLGRLSRANLIKDNKEGIKNLYQYSSY